MSPYVSFLLVVGILVGINAAKANAEYPPSSRIFCTPTTRLPSLMQCVNGYAVCKMRTQPGDFLSCVDGNLAVDFTRYSYLLNYSTPHVVPPHVLPRVWAPNWITSFAYHLNVSKNDLIGVEDQSFSASPYLQVLTLSNNKIASLKLAKNPTLKTIDLSYNNIAEVGRDTCFALPSLTSLDLSNNVITRVSSACLDLPKLTTLNLTNNRISFLSFHPVPNAPPATNLGANMPNVNEDNCFRLPNLTSLDLSNNAIRGNLASSCLDLPKLTNLNLTNCGLSSLRQSLFWHMPKLQHLLLNDNNGLKMFFPGIFAGLYHLVNVDVRSTGIPSPSICQFKSFYYLGSSYPWKGNSIRTSTPTARKYCQAMGGRLGCGNNIAGKPVHACFNLTNLSPVGNSLGQVTCPPGRELRYGFCLEIIPCWQWRLFEIPYPLGKTNYHGAQQLCANFSGILPAWDKHPASCMYYRTPDDLRVSDRLFYWFQQGNVLDQAAVGTGLQYPGITEPDTRSTWQSLSTYCQVGAK